MLKEVSVKPNRVEGLAATAKGRTVHLGWKAPREEGGAAAPSRFFVMRFRLQGGQRTFEKTVFLGPSARSYVDDDMEPGRYAYLVGGLAPSGSGPGTEVEVEVPRA